MLLPYAAKSSGDSWGDSERIMVGGKVTLNFMHLCAGSQQPQADTRWRQLSKFKFEQDYSEAMLPTAIISDK